jgi:Holliday junction resolvasome RuvABC endonuclease subunit
MNGLPLFDRRTLALDQATSTGWAYGDGELFEHGAWFLSGGSSEHAGLLLVRLEKRILETHERFGVNHIAFENASLGSKHENTKVFHNRVAGVIVATSAKIGASWAQYAPTSIKAHAGHGRYDKPQMMAALKRHYDLDVTNGDEADAIWILLLDQHRRSNPLAMAASKPKVKKGRRKAKDPTLF